MEVVECDFVIIPFDNLDNRISKDAEFYKSYNTNIHKIINRG